MPLAFIDRNPTQSEVEKLRLILSTYQDGTGMLATKDRMMTLPGWRDFERAVAVAFDREAPENKAVFDVLLRRPDMSERKSGLSCKMRRELNRVDRDGRATIELSNSAGQFWDYLREKGISQVDYKQRAPEVGKVLLELVQKWHQAASIEQGGKIDLATSFYLVLSWNRAGLYQLHQFALILPDADTLNWHFPIRTVKGIEIPARALRGDDSVGTLVEWYGESGGQLKYYPFVQSAIWQSARFRLEPSPDSEYGIQAKASAYFPELWAAACSQPE